MLQQTTISCAATLDTVIAVQAPCRSTPVHSWRAVHVLILRALPLRALRAPLAVQSSELTADARAAACRFHMHRRYSTRWGC